MKIPEKIKEETNNFGLLRLLAAFLVFFGHAILITRSSGLLNWDRGLAIGATGVNIFFVISGFLVTMSWLNNSSFVFFIVKRFLRIYPGLIVAGLFTMLIIGPLNTFLSVNHYFHNIATINYIKDIFLLQLINIKNSSLPGVFVLNKFPLIVNGSLWTIPVEVGCYLFIALLGLRKLFNKRMLFLSALLSLILYSAIASFNNNFLIFFQNNSNIPYSDIIRLVTYFISGVVIYLYKDYISISRKYFSLLSLVLFGSIVIGYFELMSYFLLPIFVIMLAFKKSPFTKKYTLHGDFSYGFYLFAFPVQQTVSAFFNGRVFLFGQVAISFFLIMTLAVLSWNFIEKPCLRFKDSSFMRHIKKDSI